MSQQEQLSLTIAEAQAIINWVEHRVGPISHEFDQPIHDWLDKVYRFVDESKRTEELSESDKVG